MAFHGLPTEFSMIQTFAGDSLELIPRLVDGGVVVDSVVTDPPYHLTARTSRFGKVGSAPPQYGKDGAMGRLSKGFMGKTWDGGDIAFRPETWATIGTVLRPGGFLLVFGGTRTYHRMTCAIEDAGFVIQDCIMWLYGTGFPKRRDMLKPAYEPIVVAYKPGGDRTMQIDECRVPGTWKRDSTTRSDIRGNRFIGGVSGGLPCEPQAAHENGRWPANICHDGSDEVISAFPYSKTSKRNPKLDIGRTYQSVYGKPSGKQYTENNTHGDDGSAARFFWSPKAGKKDRAGSRHPTVKPITLLDWLVPLVTPIGGTVLDPFAGTGTTGVAAQNQSRNAILIEREDEYFQDIQQRFNPDDLSVLLASAEKAIRDRTKASEI